MAILQELPPTLLMHGGLPALWQSHTYFEATVRGIVLECLPIGDSGFFPASGREMLIPSLDVRRRERPTGCREKTGQHARGHERRLMERITCDVDVCHAER